MVYVPSYVLPFFKVVALGFLEVFSNDNQPHFSGRRGLVMPSGVRGSLLFPHRSPLKSALAPTGRMQAVGSQSANHGSI